MGQLVFCEYVVMTSCHPCVYIGKENVSNLFGAWLVVTSLRRKYITW